MREISWLSDSFLTVSGYEPIKQYKGNEMISELVYVLFPWVATFNKGIIIVDLFIVWWLFLATDHTARYCVM